MVHLFFRKSKKQKIDNIDARMAMMDKALETVEYGKFTKRVFSLENRALYKPKMYEK